MKALQYIYTSWKNGNSTEKGYMIYSRSLGISDEDCTAIKDAMQYMVPKRMKLMTPTDQEIEKLFPYSFAYFSLPSGRKCIAQSTYLGKDYSGRYGNYIIYAMIFDVLDISFRPFELFGEEYIKTKMTEAELNASSPVPPLPKIDIVSYGTVINDDRLNEFLFERETEFAQLISFVMSAIDNKVPLFLNDTRENMVLWSSALQRILPLKIALKFTFNTYVGNHEFLYSQKAKDEGLNFCLVGVRPDANYFDYASERYNNSYVVLDFVNGFVTEGISIDNYAEAMALSMATDFEEIDLFGCFLNEISFNEFNGQLRIAYDYYKLLRYGEFNYSDKSLQDIIAFGERYCFEQFNSEVGSKLISIGQENNWIIVADTFKLFWRFCCKYSKFMIYTLFELLQNILYNLSLKSDYASEELLKLTNSLKESTPQEYEDFLEYENSPQGVEQLLLYLHGETNISTNIFYVEWLLNNYQFPNGLNNRQPVDKLLGALFNNVSKSNNDEIIIRILLSLSLEKKIFNDALKIFIKPNNERRLDSLCEVYYKFINYVDAQVINRFENLLLENPNSSYFGLKMVVKRIEKSGNPAEEFWSFYHNHNQMLSKIANFSLYPLLKTCVERLSANTKEKTVIRVLHEVNEHFLNNRETTVMLANVLESLNVKSLVSVNENSLVKFYQCYRNHNSASLPKVESVVLGNYFLNLSSIEQVQIEFSDTLGRFEVKLAYFVKNDYTYYLEKYCEAYFRLIKSEQDIDHIWKFFYNAKFLDEFTKVFIKYLKNLKSLNITRWKSVTLWTTVSILKNSQSDMGAAMKVPFIRYLRGTDEGILLGLKNSLIELGVPKTQINSLFENINRKESIYERLTNIFRR